MTSHLSFPLLATFILGLQFLQLLIVSHVTSFQMLCWSPEEIYTLNFCQVDKLVTWLGSTINTLTYSALRLFHCPHFSLCHSLLWFLFAFLKRRTGRKMFSEEVPEHSHTPFVWMHLDAHRINHFVRSTLTSESDLPPQSRQEGEMFAAISLF